VTNEGNRRRKHLEAQEIREHSLRVGMSPFGAYCVLTTNTTQVHKHYAKIAAIIIRDPTGET